LTLSEGITMTTTSGIVARLQSAEVDIGANVLSSDEPVQIEMEGMRLRADTFRASDGGNKLIFENRVRMELDPATIRQNREEESGNDEEHAPHADDSCLGAPPPARGLGARGSSWRDPAQPFERRTDPDRKRPVRSG